VGYLKQLSIFNLLQSFVAALARRSLSVASDYRFLQTLFILPNFLLLILLLLSLKGREI